MSPDRVFRGIIGALLIVAAILTYYVSLWFVLLSGFVGFMLFQSFVTGICPGMIITRKMMGK